MIQAWHIEEASINAWPALNSLLYDGWLLRFANGYTKRANSVTPLYSGELSLERKIAACEELYRQQGLPPIFRLAEISGVAELDAQLVTRAYRRIDVTSVQGRPLSAGEFGMSGRAGVLPGSDALATWLQSFHTLNPGRRDMETHEAILRRILGRVCPLVLSDGGSSVACGLGVLQGEHLGLFDVVTRKSERRKGYGRIVTESLLAWGQSQGASYAYLQVMLSNEPAQHLYAQLGFNEQYKDWYRVASKTDSQIVR